MAQTRHEEAAWKQHFLPWIHARVRDAGRRVDTPNDEFNAMRPHKRETRSTVLNRLQAKGREAGNDVNLSAMDGSASMARLPESGQKLMMNVLADQDMAVFRLSPEARAAWLPTPKS